MDLFDKCKKFTRAKELMATGFYPYFKAIQSGAGSKITVDGREVIMIGSNNYLGLTQHPKVIEALIKAAEKYGSGCTGSRFLNGTLDLHEELEENLAQFIGRQAALVFSTGFQTNLGTISALIGRDDLIFADSENHASIVDGCRLAFGKTIKYKHNDLADLQKRLKAHDHVAGRLIITDGVFSMGGEIANLPGLIELSQKYNAKLFVDDAHSIGVLGEHGNGTASHFGLIDKVDITMGTFSKSLGSIGGFIAGDEDVIHYIKHFSRPLIFSASMPPSAVATVIAALEIIQNEPERRERLWHNTKKMNQGFEQLGFNTANSETPIISVIIGEDEKTFYFWKRLFESGVYANPVISPAVPPGMSLMRTSYMATHTDDELDQVLETFEKIGRELEII